MTTSFMEVNLLPDERIRDKYSFGIRIVSFSLLTVFTITFGILGYVRLQTYQNDTISLKSAKVNQVSVQEKIVKEQETLNKGNTIQSILWGNTTILLKPFINQILASMPAGTSYSDIHFSGNSVSVIGTIQGLNDVAAFEDVLAKLKQVSTVSMSDINSSPKGNGYTFALKIVLSGVDGQ